MAIFDLTGGKYPSLNTQDLRKAVYEFNAPNTIHQRLVESQERDEIIPVFLVETAQSNTLVTIPETHFAEDGRGLERSLEITRQNGQKVFSCRYGKDVPLERVKDDIPSFVDAIRERINEYIRYCMTHDD